MVENDAAVISRYGRHEVLWTEESLSRVIGELQAERLQQPFNQLLRSLASTLQNILSSSEGEDDDPEMHRALEEAEALSARLRQLNKPSNEDV